MHELEQVDDATVHSWARKFAELISTVIERGSADTSLPSGSRTLRVRHLRTKKARRIIVPQSATMGDVRNAIGEHFYMNHAQAEQMMLVRCSRNSWTSFRDEEVLGNRKRVMAIGMCLEDADRRCGDAPRRKLCVRHMTESRAVVVSLCEASTMLQVKQALLIELDVDATEADDLELFKASAASEGHAPCLNNELLGNHTEILFSGVALNATGDVKEDHSGNTCREPEDAPGDVPVVLEHAEMGTVVTLTVPLSATIWDVKEFLVLHVGSGRISNVELAGVCCTMESVLIVYGNDEPLRHRRNFLVFGIDLGLPSHASTLVDTVESDVEVIDAPSEDMTVEGTDEDHMVAGFGASDVAVQLDAAIDPEAVMQVIDSVNSTGPGAGDAAVQLDAAIDPEAFVQVIDSINSTGSGASDAAVQLDVAIDPEAFAQVIDSINSTGSGASDAAVQLDAAIDPEEAFVQAPPHSEADVGADCEEFVEVEPADSMERSRDDQDTQSASSHAAAACDAEMSAAQPTVVDDSSLAHADGHSGTDSDSHEVKMWNL